MAKCLIITGYGLNCERETQAAFELCGAQVSLLHFNQLLARPETLQEHDILTFIGGFSFGDHLGAGVAFANKGPAPTRRSARQLRRRRPISSWHLQRDAGHHPALGCCQPVMGRPGNRKRRWLAMTTTAFPR